MMINAQADEPLEQFIKVPAAAVEQCLSEGNPVYLAVYLYALRQFYAGNTGITNTQMADALRVSPMDVVNAFLFCSSKGLVKIRNFTSVNDVDFDIEFCFSVPKKVHPAAFRPNYHTGEISRQLRDNPKVAMMYKMVSQILGKNLSSADTELLYSFYDYYGLPVEVILVLVEYCVSKGKRSMKYMEKEAVKWTDAGIGSVEAARRYIKKREEFLSYAYRIRQMMGCLDRKPTARELSYMNQWQNDWNMNLDMVRYAYELTVNQTGKASFAYMNRILESWHKSGFTKPEDAKKEKKPAAGKVRAETPRYNFEELERQAFLNINREERDEKHGV